MVKMNHLMHLLIGIKITIQGSIYGYMVKMNHLMHLLIENKINIHGSVNG